MPIPQPFYLDAPSLSQATGVYYDAALTICAPDGYYSDGTIFRYLLGCVLGAVEQCPSCGIACDGNIEINGDVGKGLFLVNAFTGDTPTDVGAIIVRFRPELMVSGIQVEYNSTIYNTFSSPIYGYLTGTAGLPVFLGATADDCGVVGGPYNLNEYGYDGGMYLPTGDVVPVTVAAGQVNTTVLYPEWCVMVIPKLTPTPAGIEITNIAPCEGTKFDIQIDCPALLKPFNGSVKVEGEEIPSPESFCLEWDVEYYTASVNGNITSGGYDLGLYDLVFYDQYGQYPMDDGWYRTYNLPTNPLPPFEQYNAIQVQNGIIVQIIEIICP